MTVSMTFLYIGICNKNISDYTASVCVLYTPEWEIQPLQSCAVIVAKLASVAVSISVMPGSMLFNSVLTFEKASSIGLRSGE